MLGLLILLRLPKTIKILKKDFYFNAAKTFNKLQGMFVLPSQLKNF